MKFIVVVTCGDFIQCTGAFDCAEAAYGEAVMSLSDIAEEGDMITPLYELEGETGFGISLKRSDGATVENACVLFTEKHHECGQCREVQNETPHV